ncbi:MAG: NAD(P)H-hydrate epimerase [Clostridiales Family XIII bacterium]|jgi:NAD(P)H-hydrate epimerase|nr:NAD(P)H-hydrate epimerase [Clostridiales Family XIII bacterium]
MGERTVTAKEMKQLDKSTIEHHGLPSLVLMERAALASVETLHTEGFDLTRVACVCGPGNNGGDGIAVCRLLYLAGYDAFIVMVGSPEKRSKETKQQLDIAKSYGIPIFEVEASAPILKKKVTTMVDALFGIGATRAASGDFVTAIRLIHKARQDGAKVLALDIPSGVSADTGEAFGETVSADVTVTFAFLKIGLTREPGLSLAGQIFVKDIGIYETT